MKKSAQDFAGEVFFNVTSRIVRCNPSEGTGFRVVNGSVGAEGWLCY